MVMHENFSEVIEMGWSSCKTELHPDTQHQMKRRQNMAPIQSQEQF